MSSPAPIVCNPGNLVESRRERAIRGAASGEVVTMSAGTSREDDERDQVGSAQRMERVRDTVRGAAGLDVEPGRGRRDLSRAVRLAGSSGVEPGELRARALDGAGLGRGAVRPGRPGGRGVRRRWARGLHALVAEAFLQGPWV